MPQAYEVVVESGRDGPIEVLEQLSDVISVRPIERSEPTHSFDVGDHALDGQEPTPSPEANTVRIVELTGQRADEFVIEETGQTVAEHENNQFYPSSDPVVAGVYPNMSSDKVWHFPESRLRPV